MSMKNSKGITLVALVVTIVVLLILAGVSINLVLGENGLISNAKEARDKTKTAEANEKSQLDSASDFISEVVNNTELPQTNETKPYMLGDGFTKVDGTNLANGLTIQDSDGNQYVWVEVPMTEEVYPTAKLGITEFNDEAYTKIENDLHTYTTAYRNNTSFRDEWYEDADNATDWYTQEQYIAQKQKMLKSVYQNGGFWVARYEAGINENRNASGEAKIAPQSKQNLYPYTYITRMQAKKLAEMVTYTKGDTKTYTGSLMFGVQWDLVLAFMHNIGNIKNETLINDSTLIGNYYNEKCVINRGKYAKYNEIEKWYNYDTDFIGVIVNKVKMVQDSYENAMLLTTGAVDQNCVMNIYDMAGNVWEWTLEYTNENNAPCAYRGGNYNDSGAENQICYRSSDRYYTKNYNNLGFRIALY